MSEIDYTLSPIGFLHSSLTSREEAPNQGYAGAPNAWFEVNEAVASGLDRLAAGDEIFLFTWLHQADRTVLKVHPQSDVRNPLTGVFATRSPDRPNPIGLHRVTILAIDGRRLQVGPLEAIDGTPIVDIKPVLHLSTDA